jgi:inhibitor of KinA
MEDAALPEILPLGDSALLIRVPNESAQRDVLAIVRCLTAAGIPGVVELVPAPASVGVFFNPAEEQHGSLISKIEELLDRAPFHEDAENEARSIEIPVCYDGEFAIDLAEVASWCGLTPDEVTRRHSAEIYRVSCLGFSPGFPYLSGLPPELATPRRATPRQEILAGSVAIGGAQTGIYPRASPGGWNVIGRTPLVLFDVAREPPALLRAGDPVRFRRIDRAEFEAFSR